MIDVSVIIPNYNHAPFLEKRIESVINQTYDNLEIIILDDCSTDNSRGIIERYRQHPKVAHIILNEQNSGSPFKQWKKGFDLAKGEHIWIAESDDYADDEFLKTVMQTLKTNPSVGLAFTDSNLIDEEGNIHRNFYKNQRNENFQTEKWNDDYVMNGIKEITSNLFYNCTINNMSAAVFNKNLLGKIDFDRLNKFTYCGDWYFLIALLMESDVAYIAKALNYFKSGPDNFKKGTKSVLNYHKERAFVKYFFWPMLQQQLTEAEKKKVYAELGNGLKIQINEVIKGKSSLLGTLKMLIELRGFDKSLFDTQLRVALQKFIWRNGIATS